MDVREVRACWCLAAVLILHVTVVENGVISAARQTAGADQPYRDGVAVLNDLAEGAELHSGRLGAFDVAQRNSVAENPAVEEEPSTLLAVNDPGEQSDRSDLQRLRRELIAEAFDSFIPPEYILAVSVKLPNQWVESSIKRLRGALSKVLQWPLSLIRVDKISLAHNMVGLYFLHNASDMALHEGGILVPIADIWQPELLPALLQEAPDLNITSIVAQSEWSVELDSKPVWLQPYFPYVVTALALVLVTILGLTVYLCCCHKGQKAEKVEEGLASQQVLFQSIKPDTKDPLAIQPASLPPPFIPKGGTTPIATQPARIRAKGLLERRGSNASLTLELSPSPELRRWKGTPPKESSALEFLLSAGHRLSRRDLRNVVKNARSIHEEFWEIPTNHPEKVSVAGSGMKNRYKTIIPNEHSRVILPDDEIDPLSSYVNANCIRGYECEPKAYIATQGPMSHTIVDFWRLVWHEKTPVIVMITKLKEKDKPKCENYLPESSGIYGDIEVVVENITEKEGYTLRTLTLRCGGEVQDVLHYWYTAWPDHKPPQSPRTLINLIKEVERNRYGPDHVTPRGPVFVHCSAGIGRTGCFIAISVGMRQLAEEHSVDVLGIICAMRLDRGGMIQTHEQYEFIHHALCEYERELEDSNLSED